MPDDVAPEKAQILEKLGAKVEKGKEKGPRCLGMFRQTVRNLFHMADFLSHPYGASQSSPRLYRVHAALCEPRTQKGTGIRQDRARWPRSD